MKKSIKQAEEHLEEINAQRSEARQKNAVDMIAVARKAFAAARAQAQAAMIPESRDTTEWFWGDDKPNSGDDSDSSNDSDDVSPEQY